jgi:YD repeat-containing protein
VVGWVSIRMGRPSGNLIDDGDRWLYRYDLLGQLVEVRARNAPPGHVFAKFTYNALGWRTPGEGGPRRMT